MVGVRECCYFCKNVLFCENRCKNDLYRCQFCAWHLDEKCKDFEYVGYEHIEKTVRAVFGELFDKAVEEKMKFWGIDETSAIEMLYYDIIRGALLIAGK